MIAALDEDLETRSCSLLASCLSCRRVYESMTASLNVAARSGRAEMVCPVPSRSFLGKIEGSARYRFREQGIYRLWHTSSQNRALVQKTPLVLTPARWIAFIPRRTPRSLRRRPCSILIQSNASTVALACPSARCRPSLRSTICRKSGRNIPRSTRSTLGGRAAVSHQLSAFSKDIARRTFHRRAPFCILRDRSVSGTQWRFS